MAFVRALLAAAFAALVHGQSAAASQVGSVSGIVRGDDGKPLAAGVHFVPRIGNIGAVRFVEALSDGSFSIPSLAAADYEICIHYRAGGYIDPCQWPTLKLSYTQPAQNTSGLQLAAPRGSILLVYIVDPQGVIDASPTGQMIVGVTSQGGMFYPMQPVSKDHTRKVYTFTVPFGLPVSVFLAAPHLKIQDERGTILAAAGGSVPVLQAAGSASRTIVFTVVGQVQ